LLAPDDFGLTVLTAAHNYKGGLLPLYSLHIEHEASDSGLPGFKKRLLFRPRSAGANNTGGQDKSFPELYPC
jgi:hypothetical protein